MGTDDDRKQFGKRNLVWHCYGGDSTIFEHFKRTTTGYFTYTNSPSLAVALRVEDGKTFFLVLGTRANVLLKTMMWASLPVLRLSPVPWMKWTFGGILSMGPLPSDKTKSFEYFWNKAHKNFSTASWASVIVDLCPSLRRLCTCQMRFLSWDFGHIRICDLSARFSLRPDDIFGLHYTRLACLSCYLV